MWALPGAPLSQALRVPRNTARSGLKLSSQESGCFDRSRCLSKYLIVNSPERRYASGGLIACLLDDVPCMALGPLPRDSMRVHGLVEARPPVVVGLSTKPAGHGLDDISRVSHHLNRARLAQSFEAESCRRYFCLLICCRAKIGADGAPASFVPQ